MPHPTCIPRFTLVALLGVIACPGEVPENLTKPAPSALLPRMTWAQDRYVATIDAVAIAGGNPIILSAGEVLDPDCGVRASFSLAPPAPTQVTLEAQEPGSITALANSDTDTNVLLSGALVDWSSESDTSPSCAERMESSPPLELTLKLAWRTPESVDYTLRGEEEALSGLLVLGQGADVEMTYGLRDRDGQLLNEAINRGHPADLFLPSPKEGPLEVIVTRDSVSFQVPKQPNKYVLATATGDLRLFVPALEEITNMTLSWSASSGDARDGTAAVGETLFVEVESLSGEAGLEWAVPSAYGADITSMTREVCRVEEGSYEGAIAGAEVVVQAPGRCELVVTLGSASVQTHFDIP